MRWWISQMELDGLRSEVENANGTRDMMYDQYQKTAVERGQLSKELDQALESNTGYENQVQSLTDELEKFSTINQAFADENRDLVRQLELYKALLAQVRVNVTLPARKRG